jgi:aminoglycoside 3'-phosphotransferase-1
LTGAPISLPASFEALIGARAWRCETAGESGGAVFRLIGDDGDLYLKHSEDGAVSADVFAEAVRLRWLQGRAPAAPFVAFAAEGDRAWLLTGALAGRSGDDWLEHDPALLPRIVDAFAGFMLRLHALPTDECPFRADVAMRLADARRRVCDGMVDEDDFDGDHANWSAAAVLSEVERLAPRARTAVVTHGDFSLGNLMLDDDLCVTGCLDVGRLGVADPYQDVAIFWQNLAEHGVATQRRFLDAIGVAKPDGSRLELHRCLDELL